MGGGARFENERENTKLSKRQKSILIGCLAQTEGIKELHPLIWEMDWRGKVGERCTGDQICAHTDAEQKGRPRPPLLSVSLFPVCGRNGGILDQE